MPCDKKILKYLAHFGILGQSAQMMCDASDDRRGTKDGEYESPDTSQRELLRSVDPNIRVSPLTLEAASWPFADNLRAHQL